METKQLFLFMFLCSLVISGYAKNDTISGPLKRGDPIPNVFIPHISNYGKSSAHFSEFKGKLVILDFWATFCKPCVAALPKLDSIQKQFNGSVQILLVNTASQEELDSLFELNSKIRMVGKDLRSLVHKFASITGDKIFGKLFPHATIPHYVWIRPDGRVAAITESKQITVSNIQAALEGDFSIPQKSGFKLDPSKAYLPQLYDADKANLKFYSSIMRSVENLGGGVPFFVTDSVARTVTISKQSTLLGFFERIYRYSAFGNPYRNPMFEYGKYLVLETADSSRFFFDNRAGISREEWNLNNRFIYEAVLPLMSREEAYACFLEDIERFFQIDSRVEKRKMKCIAIVRTSDKEKFAYDGRKTDLLSYYGEDGTYHLNGGFMKNLRYEISDANKSVPYIFLDETGYNGRVELELNAPLNDLIDLRNELKAKYDLDLVKVTREIDMVILRDMN